MAIKNPNQKLHESRNMPRVEILDDPKTIDKWGGPAKMLLAPPIEYDGLMKKIPEGNVITADRLRDYLTQKYEADFACQLTGGIFVNIAAHASEERGGEDETPWWRTLKKDGELNEKYPGGIENQKFKLECEGYEVIQKGKRYFVKDYAEKLFDINAEK